MQNSAIGTNFIVGQFSTTRSATLRVGLLVFIANEVHWPSTGGETKARMYGQSGHGGDSKPQSISGALHGCKEQILLFWEHAPDVIYIWR